MAIVNLTINTDENTMTCHIDGVDQGKIDSFQSYFKTDYYSDSEPEPTFCLTKSEKSGDVRTNVTICASQQETINAQVANYFKRN